MEAKKFNLLLGRKGRNRLVLVIKEEQKCSRAPRDKLYTEERNLQRCTSRNVAKRLIRVKHLCLICIFHFLESEKELLYIIPVPQFKHASCLEPSRCSVLFFFLFCFLKPETKAAVESGDNYLQVHLRHLSFTLSQVSCHFIYWHINVID